MHLSQVSQDHTCNYYILYWAPYGNYYILLKENLKSLILIFEMEISKENITTLCMFYTLKQLCVRAGILLNYRTSESSHLL